MSSRCACARPSGWMVVALLLIVAGGTRSAVAQTAAEFRERVDALADRWRETGSLVARAESLQQRVQVDTIVMGPLTVMTRRGERELVTEATRLARDSLHGMLGSDTTFLRSHRFAVQAFGARPLPTHGRVRGVSYARGTTAEGVATRIIRAARKELTRELDSSVIRWLSAREVHLQPPTDADWSRRYVELATSPSKAVRQCYLGDLAECQIALEVVPVGDPASRWFNAYQRREFVARRWLWRSEPAYRACIDGSDDACLELLRSHGVWPPPLSVDVRLGLLQFALELGGDGAFGRLVRSDKDTIEGRLAEVAGASPDSLLPMWRDRVMAGRPRPTTITRASGWVAFAWIVAFAVVATRSTRWRQG